MTEQKEARIMVGLDGSKHAHRALEEAVKLAKGQDGPAKIIGAHVIEISGKTLLDPFHDHIDQVMNIEAEELGSKVKKHYLGIFSEYEKKYPNLSFEFHIFKGDPGTTFVSEAENHKVDYLVVGSRGLGTVMSFLLGSMSKYVVANAKCTVVVVK